MAGPTLEEMRAQGLCGAMRRNGQRCRRTAGYMTSHKGSGSCKYHGGCSQFASGPDNPNWRHGRASKYRTPEQLAEFEKWQAASGTQHDKLSVEDEFMLFMLEDMAVQVREGTAALTPHEIADLLERIANIRLKAQKLRGGEKAPDQNVSMTLRAATVIANPEAALKACELEELLAGASPADAGGLCDADQSGPLETGAAPGATEPEAG